MSDTNKTVTIHMNKEQAWTIKNALNFYARSFLGQLDVFHVGLSIDDIHELESLYKNMFIPELQAKGASLGIYSTEVPDEARNAMDIHDIIAFELMDSKDLSNYATTHQRGKHELPVVKIK